MMNDTKKSFWATLPGVLTGIAAVITAVGGLLFTLHQTGVIAPEPNGGPTVITEEPGRSEGGASDAATQPQTGQQPTVIPEPSNESPWDGAWTNIVPANPMAQSFITKDPFVNTVSVGITTGNPGRGGDTITMRVVSEDGEILAEASEIVSEGFDGWVRFDLPDKGLRVAPGRNLIIELEDTNRVVFGWKYGLDSYPGGSAIMLGSYRPDLDFFFRINR